MKKGVWVTFWGLKKEFQMVPWGAVYVDSEGGVADAGMVCPYLSSAHPRLRLSEISRKNVSWAFESHEILPRTWSCGLVPAQLSNRVMKAPQFFQKYSCLLFFPELQR